MNALARIVSHSHPGTFAWLIAAPAAPGERWTMTVAADLPGVGLCAGDVLTIKPQSRWDCCCLYVLDSGDVVRLGMGPRDGHYRMTGATGDSDEIARDLINRRIVGRVEAVQGRAESLP